MSTDLKAQILFILTNALCAIVFAFFYPETRGINIVTHRTRAGAYIPLIGKSLEEIDEIFGDVKIVRDVDYAEKAGVQEVEIRQRH